MNKKRIYILGFMGTGKTTVAKKLANLMGYTVLELDSEIEKNMGMTIAEAFEKRGEEYFRQMEAEALRDTEKKENIVVSTGGGIVLNPQNVAWMKEQGITLLLTASPKTIHNRISSDTKRPLLKGKMGVQSIEDMLDSRREQYENAARITVNTNNKTVEEISLEIVSRLEEANGKL